MTLHLLPNLLGPTDDPSLFLPSSVFNALKEIQGLFAESERNAYRFLALFGEEAKKLPVKLVNEHTRKEEIEGLLKPLLNGESWGLISDAGLPSIGDPGDCLVASAHRHHLKVKAYVGPSSITLALLLSGLPANRFFFHHYLPIEREERKKSLLHLETLSRKEKATQIFIETPYRNDEMIKECVNNLDPHTLFAVVSNITLPTEKVTVANIKTWKTLELSLKKIPAVFLLYSRA